MQSQYKNNKSDNNDNDMSVSSNVSNNDEEDSCGGDAKSNTLQSRRLILDLSWQP